MAVSRKVMSTIAVIMLFISNNAEAGSISVDGYREVCLTGDDDKVLIAMCFHVASVALAGLGQGAYEASGKQNNFHCYTDYASKTGREVVSDFNKYMEIITTEKLTIKEQRNVSLVSAGAQFLRVRYPLDNCPAS